MKKITEKYFNKTLMKITALYFFTFASVHSIDSFLLKTIDKMMNQNVGQALKLNYLCLIKFVASFSMSYITMKLKNHQLILCLLYGCFILGLVFFHIVIKMPMSNKKYVFAIIGLIFYYTGTGAIFTMLEFIKINSLAKIRALHSVTVLSVGCCLGSGLAFVSSIIQPLIYPNLSEATQLLVFKFFAVFFALVCILLIIFACPEFDYSPNFNYDKDPLENIKTNKLNFFQSIKVLIKLLGTQFSLFLISVLLVETLQTIIKLLFRHFTERLAMKQEKNSLFHLFRIFCQVSMYFCVLKVQKEKYIYFYNILCSTVCCLRPILFFSANNSKVYSKTLFAFQSALQAVESGFQQLSLSRICNNLSSSDIKVYAHGFYLGIRNGLGPLLANFVCDFCNNGQKNLTQETYKKIFLYSISLGFISLTLSIILFFYNYWRKR
ncbi:hypothetical protein CDIK_2184 [Cucumispora dikerogammari]|nr:hypothetical protein CDIK_2184 [Cucumispora dikerogammari]